MEKWVVDLEDSLSKTGLGFRVIVWPEVLKVSMKCFDWVRRQYVAPCVIDQLHEVFGKVGGEKFVLGVGYLDAYDRGLNFVFGEAYPAYGVAVVFTKRLNPAYYGEEIDYNKYVERVSKEIVHELGHLLGLGHCRSRGCVMSFSNSVHEVDLKTRYFCDNCVADLRNRFR